MDERKHYQHPNEKREHPETRILKLEHNLEKQQITFQHEKEFTKKEAEYEKKLDAKDREIERLKDEVADLEEEIETLEDSLQKQSGELGSVASVFKGIDLAEVGAGIIRKLANPKLLNTLGMTAEEEKKTEKKAEDTSNFAAVNDDIPAEKKEQFEAVNQIASFLKEMPLNEFKKVYHILSKLEANRALIDKVFMELEKEGR